MSHPKLLDLTNLRFGNWTVLNQAGNYNDGTALWLCQCDCGRTKVVAGNSLRRGLSTKCRQCGTNKTHDRSHTPEYKAWDAMRQRCTNANDARFQWYGARGIAVDPSWDTFEQFLQDMGTRPGAAYTLERLDNDGPYSADNCVWATRLEQSRNKRTNVWITVGGETKLMIDWLRQNGISTGTAWWRIKAGWDLATAVTKPPA